MKNMKNLTKEVEQLILTPTVLKTTKGEPVELVSTSKSRYVRTRETKEIPPSIKILAIKSQNSIEAILKFSSGNLESFLNMRKAYYK
ncbi:hypothetical protein [Enterococcus sp. AZ180]|uniref:hypothetical protein n=1 Tax=Enterococcus sp. AZ180 TaxID=2774961 RepID=UPI003F682D19